MAWLTTWLADRRRERASAVPSVPAPNAPSNLSVSVEDGFFILIWQDNSSNEAGFRVYRKAFGEDYYILVEFPADWTSFGDFDVEYGVYYTWYVVAFGEGGESGRSNEVSAQLAGGA
ncbi:MAG TPA: hypothetical protein PKN20_00030 [Verrucomicrobiota bacterium]|nr:hypothetical protein [Verrucomicrobiota bacterium]